MYAPFLPKEGKDNLYYINQCLKWQQHKHKNTEDGGWGSIVSSTSIYIIINACITPFACIVSIIRTILWISFEIHDFAMCI